ncbi:hypothetical protein HPB48_002082 [Haemaphysalis longicornis]|uniref:Uncharacterized protein n=1 Tax=Haemaphysalis longicornis TaxID=44386 RepID=A0A9J6FI52_HAELO|nr:hypothetical protein HPB48_002082 [Haemaphysalis longicornis]
MPPLCYLYASAARAQDSRTRFRFWRELTVRVLCFQGLRIKKQHSTGDIDKRGVSSGSSLRSSGSNMSSASSESAQSGLTEAHTDSNASFVSQVCALFIVCSLLCMPVFAYAAAL